MAHKLSDAQKALLDTVQTLGEARPPWGYRDSGRHAAAFWRTARALEAKGLVWCLRNRVVLVQHGPVQQPTWHAPKDRRNGFGERRLACLHAVDRFLATETS